MRNVYKTFFIIQIDMRVNRVSGRRMGEKLVKALRLGAILGLVGKI